ncbi:MAG: hypothetical protein AAGJ81_08955 [Verrucomicrobiota bacterium]
MISELTMKKPTEHFEGEEFSSEQKEYLQAFFTGAALRSANPSFQIRSSQLDPKYRVSTEAEESVGPKQDEPEDETRTGDVG